MDIITLILLLLNAGALGLLIVLKSNKKALNAFDDFLHDKILKDE